MLSKMVKVAGVVAEQTAVATKKIIVSPRLSQFPQEANFQKPTSTKAKKPGRQSLWYRDVPFRLQRIISLTAAHNLHRAGIRRILPKSPVRSHLRHRD
jgi:hypothetical protein